MDISKLRNIGISAHIDSGKTTLSERILYYAGRIHRVQEVGGGATLDHMELEQERGITITSAATTVQWDDYCINLIDTPGHVDFTVEVERSLRVLDGAILVLCAVGGVQPQSLTVDRQMKRYHVPRLAFINKMDRTGADCRGVVRQIKEKLRCDAILMQLPIGAEANFEGVIDLVVPQAIYFDGELGQIVRTEAVPEQLAAETAQARQEMLEHLAMYSDELMELLLAEDDVPIPLVHKVLKSAVIEQEVTPVFLGSAYRNKGVQPLLDAITRYLPCPTERTMTVMSRDDPSHKTPLVPDADRTTVAMAFKIVDDPFGQLTLIRIYQGTIKKGETYYNQRTGRRERFSRIVRIHADKREEIDHATPGDIVAVLGIDAASGDTFAGDRDFGVLERIFVPEPVIRVAIEPLARGDGDRLAKALARFRKEDPTFSATIDTETGETIIAGMGELHLDVYVERIRREYKVALEVGAPKVHYREAPTHKAEFNYRHRKQTGGSGQYAHIVGHFDVLDEGQSTEQETVFDFEDHVRGGRVPREFIPAVEKGFRSVLEEGPVAGFPIVGLKAVLEDGSSHAVDSSDMAFRICARDCLRRTFPKTSPVLLEPVMRLSVDMPGEFQGVVTGDLSGRRGIIHSTEMRNQDAIVQAEVPLAETFGYATSLRSMTQGQGTFTMEFARYRQVPASLQREIVADRKAAAATPG